MCQFLQLIKTFFYFSKQSLICCGQNRLAEKISIRCNLFSTLGLIKQNIKKNLGRYLMLVNILNLLVHIDKTHGYLYLKKNNNNDLKKKNFTLPYLP